MQHLLLTFFEPTFARRAFPCFDEPDFKAIFTVTIVRPEGYTALSTMPVQKQEERSHGFVADTFAPTMPMSTYTLAFAVLNFSSQSNGNVNMISLPSFLADAMENWGLLTFHEQCLLYDERSTPYKKPLIAGLIAHEIAHQWFGNLVTMNWWSDLWLNEGFATYMQYTGADYIQQQWRMMDLFVVNEMQPILRAESTVTAHPVSVTSNSTHHLDALFDRIVYSKVSSEGFQSLPLPLGLVDWARSSRLSLYDEYFCKYSLCFDLCVPSDLSSVNFQASSVIRMMVHFLTPEVFIQGLKSYLKKYRFKNVKQEDLFHELSAAQGSEPKVNVKRVMRSWLKTPGYPLLTATRNYTTGAVSVKQQAYAPAGNTQKDTKTTWNIPITYTSMSEKNFDRNGKIEWLNKREGKLKRKVEGGNKWLIINIQRVGYYRVNYDVFNWRLLQSQLRDSPEAIHVLNRAQLIDDALDLAKNGHLPYEVALEFLDLVRPEDDYMPWKSALDAMHDLDFLIRKTKYYRKYQVFVRFILERKFEAFIQEKRSNLSIADDLLRKAVIMNSCYFENEACLAFSTNKFRSFLNDSSKIQK
ncbi:aminopeptidase N-like [Dermacentor variabilis]|uniref:aminopeptidase N-like n=1 Tax=Dermacentor variabilis TaxID=34621 RepID=UPI003F5BE0F3